MAAKSKSLSQQYYEEVEALKSDGMSNPEAIREVARKHNKKENAVRGGIHQYKRAHINGDAPSSRRSPRTTTPPTVDGYLADARKALEDAVALIDREVEQAKAALDDAQARYDEVSASVAERKADIEKKLNALA